MIGSEYGRILDAEWKRLAPVFDEPVLDWSGSCVLDNRTYDKLPLLRDRMGRVVEAATTWLLHLTLTGARPRTVNKSAYVMRMYWSFRGSSPWTQVSSDLMRLWRNHLVGVERSNKRVNYCIDVVVAFYRWAQEETLINGVVGATPPGGQPYPIRLVQGRGRKGRWVSEVREPAGGPSRQEVPDVEDVDTLYARLSGPHEARSERNCLVADLAVGCGLRRDEILSMTTDDVPSKAALQELWDKGKAHRLSVVGKGGKKRVVPVLPEMMLKLREHIRVHRKTLLGPTTRLEKSLFLSSRTGRRVNAEWISRLVSRAFGSTEERKLGLHRLRARYASLIVLTLAKREMKTRGLNGIREDLILYAAAEVLGHVDINTLRYYVSLAVKTLRAQAEGRPSPADTLAVDMDVLQEVARSSPSKAAAKSTRQKRSSKSMRRRAGT